MYTFYNNDKAGEVKIERDEKTIWKKMINVCRQLNCSCKSILSNNAQNDCNCILCVCI